MKFLNTYFLLWDLLALDPLGTWYCSFSFPFPFSFCFPFPFLPSTSSISTSSASTALAFSAFLGLFFFSDPFFLPLVPSSHPSPKFHHSWSKSLNLRNYIQPLLDAKPHSLMALYCHHVQAMQPSEDIYGLYLQSFYTHANTSKNETYKCLKVLCH